MPRITCADLTGTCDTTLEGPTGRDVLLAYIGHANRQHRDDRIALDAVIAAISDELAMSRS